MNSAQLGVFLNIGSDRIFEKKKSGRGSGSGGIRVLKYAIGYFRVPYLISGTSRHIRYVKWKILHFFAIEPGISGLIACSHIVSYICLYSQQDMVIEDL